MEHGCIKDQWPYINQNKYANPSQEHPASSKDQNLGLKEIDILCNFKIKIESQNLEHGCIKDQLSYLSQDKDAKAQSGTSSVFQSPI